MIHKVLSVYAIQSDSGRHRGHLIMWEIHQQEEKGLKMARRRFKDEDKTLEQMFHKVAKCDKEE